MRPPKLEHLATAPVLGVLATLDVALVVLARSLRAAHPDIDRVARPGDDPCVAAALSLVDHCDGALYAIEHYRDQLYLRLRRPLPDPAWPF
jgi:hypothetical protein